MDNDYSEVNISLSKKSCYGQPGRSTLRRVLIKLLSNSRRDINEGQSACNSICFLPCSISRSWKLVNEPNQGFHVKIAPHPRGLTISSNRSARSEFRKLRPVPLARLLRGALDQPTRESTVNQSLEWRLARTFVRCYSLVFY